MEPATSWIIVGLVTTDPQWELHFQKILSLEVRASDTVYQLEIHHKLFYMLEYKTHQNYFIGWNTRYSYTEKILPCQHGSITAFCFLRQTDANSWFISARVRHTNTCASSPGTVTHTTWAGMAPLTTFEQNQFQVQVCSSDKHDLHFLNTW